MIKVGFVIIFRNNQWLGGINYYRNLLNAILENPQRNIEPVIFTSYDVDNKFFDFFPKITIIKDHIFDLNQPFGIIRNKINRLLCHDVLLEHLLKKNDISVLSHYGSLGKCSSFLTIGWIPDFQHKYLPDFFSQKEIEDRDKCFQSICAECTRVIFSSNNAKSDAEKFLPEYSKKYCVLHFIAGDIDFSGIMDFTSLKEKYQINEPYFIVPNQFWVHKNHVVILEALKILKARGHSLTVIATGNTSDYRKPNYFKELQRKIQTDNISENFKVVGIVPYQDLIQLMIHAVAVLNPSLFEGWSTSVEESKALNLNVILSDIPVHREQNPDYGIFFPPNDSERLADILFSCLFKEKMNFGKEQLRKISEKTNMEKMRFASNYEKIIMDILNEDRT